MKDCTKQLSYHHPTIIDVNDSETLRSSTLFTKCISKNLVSSKFRSIIKMENITLIPISVTGPSLWIIHRFDEYLDLETVVR